MNPWVPDLPDEFLEFWQLASEEARSAPLDFHRDLNPTKGETGHLVETYSFRGINGDKRLGWLAYEEGSHPMAERACCPTLMALGAGS